MAVTLDERSLAPFERLSLYNSPYPAHDEGCAIDLYPGTGRGTEAPAPSPVAGVVSETRTVRAPAKPYAPTHDHLIVLDVEGPGAVAGTVARVLHVDPVVAAGDRVAVGDHLGTLVRAGFFAPWVADHVHLGFRRPDQNPVRARGSLPVALDVDPVGHPWDGTGTVVESAETYARLDAPGFDAESEEAASGGEHPGWVGVAADGDGVLDGGLPHYDGGGLVGRSEAGRPADAVRLAGRRVGTARGRTVEWENLRVLANGDPITGLSFSLARPDAAGVRLVWRDPNPDRFPPGTEVRVTLDPV